MPDFRGMFQGFAVLLGLFTGCVLTGALALLGHGWWSLLALPITPFAMWLPVRVFLGADA